MRQVLTHSASGTPERPPLRLLKFTPRRRVPAPELQRAIDALSRLHADPDTRHAFEVMAGLLNINWLARHTRT
jgi:hypothetical protein